MPGFWSHLLGAMQQTAAPRFRLHKTLPLECSTGSEASSLVQQIRQAAAWCGKEKPPRVLAIINPKSGQGRAVKLFQSCVQPVLEGAAGMSVTSMVTQHAGHASQLVAGLNLDSVDLLAVVGGDGLVFEGLQVGTQVGCSLFAKLASFVMVWYTLFFCMPFVASVLLHSLQEKLDLL
eukprot:GHRR01034623.1.p1 GENE.GHRR01034623.1~~GHRR01034623.1.p1  ORF type:complete len:177 (+),score=60.27 GHRR01034623.1:702-1232(+)